MLIWSLTSARPERSVLNIRTPVPDYYCQHCVLIVVLYNRVSLLLYFSVPFTQQGSQPMVCRLSRDPMIKPHVCGTFQPSLNFILTHTIRFGHPACFFLLLLIIFIPLENGPLKTIFSRKQSTNCFLSKCPLIGEHPSVFYSIIQAGSIEVQWKIMFWIYIKYLFKSRSN